MITAYHPTIRNALLWALGAGLAAFLAATWTTSLDPQGIAFHQVTYPVATVFTLVLWCLAYFKPKLTRVVASLLCAGLTVFFTSKTAWILLFVDEDNLLKELSTSSVYFTAIYVIAFIIPGIPYARVMAYGFLGMITLFCSVYIGFAANVSFLEVKHPLAQLILANFSISAMVWGFQAYSDHITESNTREKALKTLAETDSLTRLPNRLGCLNVLRKAVEGEREFAVVFVDLDKFKQVNDVHGHECGDALLRGVAQRLRDRVREQDVLTRIAGDEFVFVVFGVRDEGAARSVINKLASVFEEPFLCLGKEIKSSASMGFCLYPEHGDTPDALLHNADQAMYRVKRSGRGGVGSFGTVITAAEAIEGGQIGLVYQPIFYTGSKTVYALEALLRWNHPDRGILSGRNALELLEDKELLETYILGSALKQFGVWESEGFAAGGVAVNVSPTMLLSETFARKVENALKVNDIAAHNLLLELPEAMFADEASQNTLYKLHALGVRLVMDDFGTGHSSILTLTHHAIDAVKLDVSVTRSIGVGSKEMHALSATVSGIVAAARELKLTTIAEGVERPESDYALRGLGVQAVQGYFYGRPLQKGDVTSILPRHTSPTGLNKPLN